VRDNLVEAFEFVDALDGGLLVDESPHRFSGVELDAPGQSDPIQTSLCLQKSPNSGKRSTVNTDNCERRLGTDGCLLAGMRAVGVVDEQIHEIDFRH
jgi:hypothetical protein